MEKNFQNFTNTSLYAIIFDDFSKKQDNDKL